MRKGTKKEGKKKKLISLKESTVSNAEHLLAASDYKNFSEMVEILILKEISVQGGVEELISIKIRALEKEKLLSDPIGELVLSLKPKEKSLVDIADLYKFFLASNEESTDIGLEAFARSVYTIFKNQSQLLTNLYGSKIETLMALNNKSLAFLINVDISFEKPEGITPKELCNFNCIVKDTQGMTFKSVQDPKKDSKEIWNSIFMDIVSV